MNKEMQDLIIKVSGILTLYRSDEISQDDAIDDLLNLIDHEWNEGLKEGKKDASKKLLQLSELEKLERHKDLIELIETRYTKKDV